jgi:SAM-dependent methyltransferase
MRQSSFTEYRQRLVPDADGRVLEIGSGSGLNLPFYSERANQVLGLDSSKTLLSWARKSASPTHAVMWLQASAEAIPLDDASVDTVLTTWTLCSIPDVAGALKEVRRVLKPSGRLLFVEHGRAQDANVSVWQDRLTPLWKRVAGGCHLNRAIDRLIEASGFQIERLATGYMKGPRSMTFMYEGCARPNGRHAATCSCPALHSNCQRSRFCSSGTDVATLTQARRCSGSSFVRSGKRLASEVNAHLLQGRRGVAARTLSALPS